MSQNFTYSYDPANKLTSRMMPNGITSTFDYDGVSRLTRLKHQSTTATLVDNNFAYNPANQISQIAELAQTRNLTYDNVNRVTAMTNGTSNESYAFDGVGNRAASHRSSTYSYQPFNRMTATATATMNYDSNGNLIGKSDAASSWVYSWDYENRMTELNPFGPPFIPTPSPQAMPQTARKPACQPTQSTPWFRNPPLKPFRDPMTKMIRTMTAVLRSGRPPTVVVQKSSVIRIKKDLLEGIRI